MAGLIPPGTIVETDALNSAPLWRREPFRVLFPLGMALAWAGVGHWLLYALGVLPEYRSVFHAMTQIQGFLMCFATGFLFTMIPRRTGTAPPSALQMIAAVVTPVATSVLAWHEQWAWSQIAWMALVATIVVFIVTRFASSQAKRRPPNSFVWIPASLLMGLAGSVMTALFGIYGEQMQWAHIVGRGLILQGMFTGLILGVGGLALPLMTRGQPSPDGVATPADRLRRAGHLAAVAMLVGSFWVGYAHSLQLAYAIRAAVVTAVLLLGAELWRFPNQEGWNRRLIWFSAWMVPLGYVLAALWPENHKAGLHVTFIGGFALLAMGVSTQVTLGHGGFRDLMLGRPWQVLVMGILLLAATVPRSLMEIDPRHYSLWLATAALLFLAGTAVWAAFLVPKMLRRT